MKTPRQLLLTGFLALPLCLAGCGTESGEGLGLSLRLQALQGGEVLQLVVLQSTDTTGAEVTCTRVEATCIADQPSLRVVALKIDGEEQRAYRIPLDTADATGANGQSLELPGIPPGSGYLLGVELALDEGAGEQRVGRGCVQLPEIKAGTNDALAAPIEVLETADGCNPTL